MSSLVRYCRRCDTEFQPHIARCSDCGEDLEDRFEEDAHRPPEASTEATGESVPPDDYEVVLVGVTGAMAHELARRLTAAEIPFHLGVQRRQGLRLSVPPEEAVRARSILEQAGAIPPQPSGDTVVAETGGPCPACGVRVEPGTTECPDCGLMLGSEPATCPSCGAEMADPLLPCTHCAGGRG